MKFKNVFLLAAFLLGVLSFCSNVGAESRVEQILKEADTWIIQDTSRILSFIDGCNRVTDETLRNSKHWQ